MGRTHLSPRKGKKRILIFLWISFATSVGLSHDRALEEEDRGSLFTTTSLISSHHVLPVTLYLLHRAIPQTITCNSSRVVATKSIDYKKNGIILKDYICKEQSRRSGVRWLHRRRYFLGRSRCRSTHQLLRLSATVRSWHQFSQSIIFFSDNSISNTLRL
ncbi:hypothetical protein ABFS82_03G024200 [Erythranthe guttata]